MILNTSYQSRLIGYRIVSEFLPMTASSVQVREKIHSRSVGRWQKFEKHLLPLKKFLQDNGVIIKQQ